MNHRHLQTLSLAMICSVAATYSSPAQTTVFVDTFANGIVADADQEPNFWMTLNVSSGSAREADGQMILQAGGPESPASIRTFSLHSGNPTDEFNFFKKKLTFACKFTFIGDTTDPNAQNLRLALTSANKTNYNSPDALAIHLRPKMIFAGCKTGQPSATPTTVKWIPFTSLPSPVTGFEMTLDSSRYQIRVFHETGQKDFAAEHGLKAETWGRDGRCALELEVIRGPEAGKAAIVRIDQLTVMAP